MRDDDKTEPGVRVRRDDASTILTPRSAPENLGRLAPIDSTRLEPGVVLWDRFCIVDAPREIQGHLVVAVTDLERDPEHAFGAMFEARLELYQLPAPRNDDRPRWLRAFSVRSRVQARVYAYASVGEDSIALLCDPGVGAYVTETSVNGEFALQGRALVVFAYELAGLLAALHQTGARGVRFDLERVRVKDGHYSLDGFSHLQLELEDQEHDLESLMELIRVVGGNAASSLLEPAPTSVLNLWRRLGSRDGVLDINYLPSEPPFVGRDDALSSLRHGFDQAQIAKTTITIVRGPRGVGKSRLLREFAAQRLKADDSLVLTGAWEHDSANNRGGLIGALDLLPRALSRLSEDERDDIRMRINYATRGVSAVVARSAPLLQTILRRVEDLPPLDLGEDFTRHTAAIADLFRSLGTSKRPLVVILDNLERADASSIAMLNILAEPQPAHHTLVLIGYRSDGGGADPHLEADTVEILPLGVENVVDLLTRTLPGTLENIESVADLLCSGSNGLPLSIWSSLRTWLDRGYLSRNGGDGVWRAQGSAGDAQETGGRALFGPRLASLSPAIRQFALHAALLGVKLSDDEVRYLGAALDIPSDDATEDLLRLGILIQTAGGVRFAHGSIREFVSESFGESEHRAGHERIAKMLVERQGPIAQIAYHRDLAFDPSVSDPVASDRLSRLHIEAGRERLSVYDLERSRWHLEQSLEYSRDSEQRAIAAEGLADVCLLLKDLDTAVSLYTAIIATADKLRSIQVAGKVTQFLFFQSAFKSGRALGAMAFEQLNQPLPTTPLGNITRILSSAIRSWLFGPPKMDPEQRDAIVRTHLWVSQMCFVDDPLALLAHVAHGMWVGRGLETSPVAMLMSFEAFLWGAVAGRFEHGNELFKKALEIATVKVKDFWAEAYVRHNWAIHLLSSNNYEKGQDMADDAIGAFRDAGDVSPTSVTLMFKGLYGRDHEPAEKILRWFDEAISASRRNGKTLCLVPLQCLRLHILARQNPERAKLQLVDTSKMVDCEETAGERLVARTHLTFACYECSEWDLGKEQILKAIADIVDGPGVPEFCQDFYLAAAFVFMELPNPSRADRKLLRTMLKKFRGFAKRSPRLGSYEPLLDLKLAVKAGDTQKVQELASKMVAVADAEQNVYVAYQAHRALSSCFKGEKVLEAAEHERMAREYGRHIGFGDFTLSAFAEVQDELAERGFRVDTRFDDSFMPAGLLTVASSESSPRAAGSATNLGAQSDVLVAWALNQPVQTFLGDILEPVRGAVSNSIPADRLELSCSDPRVKIPLESSALQVLVITMLLACRDPLDIDATFSVRFEEGRLEPGSSVGELKDLRPGRYLTIRVSARGVVVQNSMIGGYTTCEHLVGNLGGQLTASKDKVSATLIALIPLPSEVAEANVVQQLLPCVIVHPDPEVRESLGVALDQVGAPWRAFEPHEFGPANIEQAKVILAHSGVLDDLVVLGPLLNAQLVEIVAAGEEPAYYDHEPLHMPPTASRIKELVYRS